MDAEKAERLERLLADLQNRWGSAAPRKGSTLTIPPHIATGFAALDSVLGGGIPLGQTTELLGSPTSGVTTLAYKLIAQAQGHTQRDTWRDGRYALYIDLDSSFDADYARRCGVVLARVFIARPETDTRALDIAADLLAVGSVALLVLDMGHTLLSYARLHRLTRALARSGCALLLLSLAGTQHIGSSDGTAALRLLVERQGWLQRGADIRGYHARITVLRQRGAAAQQQVMITIDFDENIAGEPL